MSSQMEVLKLYKLLLRESSRFSAYNFRHYAIRRIRDAFRDAKTLTDKGDIENRISDGYRNLEIIKRQVLIGQMYSAPKLVVERSETS